MNKNSRHTVEKSVSSVNHLSDQVSLAFNQMLSNLRLSISLRITINYCRMLLKSAMIIWLIFSCVFAGAAWLNANNQADLAAGRLRVALESNQTYDPVLPENLSRIRILDPTGKIYFSNWYTDEESENFWPQGTDWPISLEMGRRFASLQIPRLVSVGLDRWHLDFSYNLSEWLLLYLAAILGLMAVDGFRMFYFLIRSKKLNQAVLKPIDEIAETSRIITAENLSQRINIHGTKNELKDLALVINGLLDRLESAYNSQKQFVSDASHELRTPIAVIQGYAGLLERWGKSDPAVTEEALSAIVNEATNMQKLVENLLFLARHDKQTWKLALSPVLAHDLVEEIAKDTEVIAVHHQVKVGPLDESVVLADKNALKQALRIFADNSIKYTPEGGQIGFSCRREGAWTVMTVWDTGQGVSKDDLGKIFDRFYRADPSRNSRVEGHGYGLGLSIAKIIVSAHGGKIRVRSTPGAGSEFSILLKRELV